MRVSVVAIHWPSPGHDTEGQQSFAEVSHPWPCPPTSAALGCTAMDQSLWFLSQRQKAASAHFQDHGCPCTPRPFPTAISLSTHTVAAQPQSSSGSPVKHGAGIQIPTLPTSLVALSSWRLQAPFSRGPGTVIAAAQPSSGGCEGAVRYLQNARQSRPSPNVSQGWSLP